MNRRALMAAISAAFLPLPASVKGAAAKGGAGRTPTGYLRTNWSKDPFAFGSYSFVAKGAANSDREVIAAPVGGRLFFAGEACNPKGGSSVHAAHQSGLIAAEEIRAAGARRIAVIGAGVAGLTAAHALAPDHEVTVLEARSRIGGRILTDETSLGAPVDLGASWIHGAEGNPIDVIADKVGAARVETDDSYVARDGDGEEMSWWSLPGWLDEVSNYQHSAGSDKDELNELAYLFQDDLEGAQLVFPNGYAQIFAAFRGDYETRLETPVSRIAHGPESARLSTPDGEASFDAVLVTVPLGVLKAGSIAFDPPLPEEKRDAIACMGMGLLDKVYLRFDEPFWDDATWIITTETGLPPGQFNEWLNLDVLFGVPIIMAFNGGSPARDLADLPDEEVIARAASVLSSAYP